MAAGRRGGGGRPKGPAAGSILTGIIVGQAKRGVMVELGSREILLPRTRYGTAVDRIEASGYGDPLTVEVVADAAASTGTGLTRVGIERSLRQPRSIEARLDRAGSGFVLAPADASAPFDVMLLDRLGPDALVGSIGRWTVGGPYRDRRFVLLDDS